MIMLASCAFAEHDAYVSVTEHSVLGKGASYVSWPEVVMADEEAAHRINAQLEEDCQLQAYLSLLAGVGESGAGLS